MVSGGGHDWFGICCFLLCCGYQLHENNHFFLQSFSRIYHFADCLHEEMSLYFASSLDIISLTMPTPDDQAVNAVMGDQGEVDTPDPMSLDDQIALRDAVENDIIAVSSLTHSCVLQISFIAVAALGCGLLSRPSVAAMVISIIYLSFSFDRSQIQALTPPRLMMGACSRSLTSVPRDSTMGSTHTLRTLILVLDLMTFQRQHRSPQGRCGTWPPLNRPVALLTKPGSS